jgi:hypothetical protein
LVAFRSTIKNWIVIERTVSGEPKGEALALKVDDTSITQALKLKHYKEFCEAIKAADDPTKIVRVKEFRNKFNCLSLPDSDEKGWVQTIGATVANTGKNITESFTWAVALRQKLNGPNLDTLRNAIEN